MRKILEAFGEPISNGGQETFVISVLKHMNLDDLKVDLFTPYYCDNDNYAEFIKEHNGKIFAGNVPFVVGGTRKEVIPVLKTFLAKNRYDVIHIHSGSTSILAYYAKIAKDNNIQRIIVHSHSSGEKENIKHILIKTFASRIFKKCATDYCACSLAAAKWKFPKSILPRVEIIRNGVDLDKFGYNEITRNNIRNNFKISESTLVLGHVGRFTHEKNQTFLIDVLNEYINSNPGKQVKMILVGDGDELESVKSKTQKLHLENNVIFTGASDHVSDIMQAFDIFIFPSLYEGLGIVGIEAQAAGLPVIASKSIPKEINVLGNVEFINLNEGPQEWAKAINNVKISSRNVDKKLFIREQYDVNYTAYCIKKLYE
ncbi:MAG: glycosyltransferase [Lachnospiraceae bacterium]|jgi:glycosyltransferase involved in cell wall biosynthesis